MLEGHVKDPVETLPPRDPRTAGHPHPRLSTGKTRWIALMRFLLPILAPGERGAAHRLKHALNFD